MKKTSVIKIKIANTNNIKGTGPSVFLLFSAKRLKRKLGHFLLKKDGKKVGLFSVQKDWEKKLGHFLVQKDWKKNRVTF